MNEMTVMATSVGWVGAAGTVGAYALVSLRRLDAHSLRFQLINVVGAALLCVSALTTHNWPSMVSNLIWMYLGSHALLQAVGHAGAEAGAEPVPAPVEEVDELVAA